MPVISSEHWGMGDCVAANTHEQCHCKEQIKQEAAKLIFAGGLSMRDEESECVQTLN